MKPEKYVVSLSGGKDSTAMLLRLLEEKRSVDLILFCDTGLEFPRPLVYGHSQNPCDRCLSERTEKGIYAH